MWWTCLGAQKGTPFPDTKPGDVLQKFTAQI